MKAISFVVFLGLLHVVTAKIFYKSNIAPKFSLSMMDSSVDDMYMGCIPNMTEMVVKYFQYENKSKVFADVWKKAKNCMNRSMKRRPEQDVNLKKVHLQALCVYTAGGRDEFYTIFNKEVRTGARAYNSHFPYHALHFWLTTAIQILGSNNQTCHYTYRRTTANFSGKIHQKIRFGTFASTSFRADLTRFGKETCFYIKTCLGAYLKDYSRLRSEEQEVLIPPYEIFEITKKGMKGNENLKDCAKIYVLESAGVLSNLNCKAAFNKNI